MSKASNVVAITQQSRQGVSQ